MPNLVRAVALALVFLLIAGALVALWRRRHCSAEQAIVCGPALRGNAQVCALLALAVAATLI